MNPLPPSALFAYGLFGLPLALAALPVYVYIPQFYAERFGLPLSAIGVALLAARLLDAFTDPAIGAWIDRAKGKSGYSRFVLIALPLLLAGFVGLFHPPPLAADKPLAWLVATLILAYAGFSVATIAHQSWGAALTQTLAQRSRVTAVREACGLLGVVLAAALPGWIGLEKLSWVFALSLAAGAAVLLTAARPPRMLAPPPGDLASPVEPFRNRRFRWLFAAFAINGIAAAIPATLFLFFAGDRLQLAERAGLFLVLYFVAGAASMPFWAALARRFGEARAWLLSMLLAVGAFVWSYGAAPGAAAAFGAICVASGFALGADLALPPALLTAVMANAGHSGYREGVYFGVWNWGAKMNLALAAGIALPLLERLGYVPGAADADGVWALGIAYALVPCMLKLAAALVLLRAPLKDL